MFLYFHGNYFFLRIMYTHREVTTTSYAAWNVNKVASASAVLAVKTGAIHKKLFFFFSHKKLFLFFSHN